MNVPTRPVIPTATLLAAALLPWSSLRATTPESPPTLPPDASAHLEEPTPPPKLGPVLPENIPLWDAILGDASFAWMQRARLRCFGWINGGYSWSDTGEGQLATAPRPDRFSAEWILDQAAIVVERTLDPKDWSWGARAEFFCGADAALLRPLNGFGPDDNPRFGTDFRQLYGAFHVPGPTEGGVDVKLGRQYLPIGYESTMSPYRPMYSAPYLWFYSQTGAMTGGSATWHVNPTLDVITAVTLGFNTFFAMRGDQPCYLARGIWYASEARRTRWLATVYTGEQPIASVAGHVPDWQTVLEAQVVHDWSRRFTTALDFNYGWDNHSAPSSGTCHWTGAYALGIVHLSPRWDLNLRAEVFNDTEGSRTGTAATYGEGTVGLNFMPRAWLNFRPEIRWDVADHPAYGSPGSTDRERDQITLAIDCLVKF